MTYRQPAPRVEEPPMPVRYTASQDTFAWMVMSGSALVGVPSIITACVAWYYAALTVAGPFTAISMLSAVMLGWALRVQWRYAGQTSEDGK